jgi:adenylate kinase family enzyme
MKTMVERVLRRGESLESRPLRYRDDDGKTFENYCSGTAKKTRRISPYRKGWGRAVVVSVNKGDE